MGDPEDKLDAIRDTIEQIEYTLDDDRPTRDWRKADLLDRLLDDLAQILD